MLLRHISGPRYLAFRKQSPPSTFPFVDFPGRGCPSCADPVIVLGKFSSACTCCILTMYGTRAGFTGFAEISNAKPLASARQ